ncbi:MAG: DUF2148 domain-containing protein [Prevotellaceae bacterium]|jgi:uncharacterized ferredoxin-like protein|nr:DUF2148 domain-containing protein [Prevotellaceae bacterium]
MLVTEQESRRAAIVAAAQQMLAAARTAPKGKGRDTLALAAAYDGTLAAIADKMEEMGKDLDIPFFFRDAKNIRQSQAVVLIGTAVEPLGLKHCGFCGMGNCENKNTQSGVPCAINTVDLGIAIGSAVAVAARFCVDTRIMFSAGKAAVELGLLGNGVKIAFAIPVSCSSKNPYFDR